jgi:NAD(P)-dependent dehydrogenase (short-subunit alcohol dehydrogenase family)
MRMMLEGRTVIVLGVGPAMGRATALMCAREGANVVLAAYAEGAYRPFSSVAPVGSDWREGGQRKRGRLVPA